MANLAGLEAKILKRGDAVAEAAARRLEEVLRAAAPISETVPGSDRQPGELRRSISVTQVEGGPVLRYRAVAEAPHAAFVEEGTDPHRIDGNPLLVFHWPKAGGVVYLRHVNHPGTTPRPFFRPNVERWGELLQEEFDRGR